MRAGLARRSMLQLTDSPDVFETFFEHAAMGLALADLSTRYVRVNSTYAELVGRLPEDLIGVSFAEILHPDDRMGDDRRVQQLLDGTELALQAEERYVGPDGRTLWVLHGVTVVPGAGGEPAWFAVSAQDITERRRVEHELRDLTATLAERAVRDPLTGLANRTLLHERLRGILARDARAGTTTALLFLDLDGFKAINDRHGHAVGDLVLKVVADRLTAIVRPSDTVARLGGDEFVVLVEGALLEGLDDLVARVKTSVEQPIGKLQLIVGVSIGVAVSRAGEAEPSALLASADRAMYGAKGGHRASRVRTLPPPR
ncbi:MAG: diguanylate cyclase/phosphodiesterase & domain with sensor(s) [Frankiales bacterium]|nr:diguanylate cyclase/phosphodiesterase & domain with sensor(s) [Frankiales bacterium]